MKHTRLAAALVITASAATLVGCGQSAIEKAAAEDPLVATAWQTVQERVAGGELNLCDNIREEHPPTYVEVDESVEPRIEEDRFAYPDSVYVHFAVKPTTDENLQQSEGIRVTVYDNLDVPCSWNVTGDFTLDD